MDRHKRTGEPARTAPRTPPLPADVDLYREHHERLLDFTDALRERRCRRTAHFGHGLAGTIAAFRPLFAPWNMEILFALYVNGPARFNGLKRALDGVSSRVLTDKLRHLATEGLVSREEEGEGVRYSLTPRGEAVARHLHPLLFYLHNAPDAVAP